MFDARDFLRAEGLRGIGSFSWVQVETDSRSFCPLQCGDASPIWVKPPAAGTFWSIPQVSRLESHGWKPESACLHRAGTATLRHSVDYLYSLYDALVSINVPNDKARAVVDAMERDMGNTIATKSDLQLLRQEMALLATKADVSELRAELRQEIAMVRKDMEILSTTMTVRLGSMLMFGLGLLFAALKLS